MGGATALRSITVDTSGLIHIAQGASLRTSNGGVVSAVSNFPPRLRLNPPNPSLPLTNANPVQTVTGTLGGDPANYPGDNTETGANFHLVVVWADGVTARNPAGVIINAGDSVTLTVNQEGTIQQWVVTPGTGQGPVNLTLVHPYSFAFLATVGAKVKVTVTVTNDPSIHLKDAQTTAQNDLGQAQASVSTPVAGNDFEAPALPPAFVEPAAIVVAAPQVVPATNQADTLQVARVEYAPVQTGKVEEQTRRLILVKVGPGGQEEEVSQLPDDALQRLNEILERFKKLRLPNGLYRIYIEETGFPRRQLREFYKSGDAIGDPVREPGPGSNRLDQGGRKPRDDSQGPGSSEQPIVPVAPQQQPDLPADPPAASPAPPAFHDDAAAGMWRTLGKLSCPLAAAAVIAVAGTQHSGLAERRAASDQGAGRPPAPRLFDRAVRLRRRFRDRLPGN